MEGDGELILAIDPGCIDSAYVMLDENLKATEFGKVPNEELLTIIQAVVANNMTYARGKWHFAIEMVASYGMPVGKEVFETVFWIGRFWEVADFTNKQFIYRKDEKVNLCGSMKAKDSNITQALKDRFGDKGTKKNPGWFFGFSKDVWQAYAVGVTYSDLYLAGRERA